MRRAFRATHDSEPAWRYRRRATLDRLLAVALVLRLQEDRPDVRQRLSVDPGQEQLALVGAHGGVYEPDPPRSVGAPVGIAGGGSQAGEQLLVREPHLGV